MTTDSGNLTYRQLRHHSHPHCVVCAQSNGLGLGLAFRVCSDGTVEATFSCDDAFQGYAATLHGGVICTLLDGAMTNCLFAHGYAAVTAEMQVRFRHPVATGSPATVRGWITSSMSPLHVLAAELLQDGRVMATATGKFMEKSAVGWFGKEAGKRPLPRLAPVPEAIAQGSPDPAAPVGRALVERLPASPAGMPLSAKNLFAGE